MKRKPWGHEEEAVGPGRGGGCPRGPRPCAAEKGGPPPSGFFFVWRNGHRPVPLPPAPPREPARPRRPGKLAPAFAAPPDQRRSGSPLRPCGQAAKRAMGEGGRAVPGRKPLARGGSWISCSRPLPSLPRCLATCRFFGPPPPRNAEANRRGAALRQREPARLVPRAPVEPAAVRGSRFTVHGSRLAVRARLGGDEGPSDSVGAREGKRSVRRPAGRAGGRRRRWGARGGVGRVGRRSSWGRLPRSPGAGGGRIFRALET